MPQQQFASIGTVCLNSSKQAYDFAGKLIGTCQIGVPDGLGDCVNGDSNIYDSTGKVLSTFPTDAKNDTHIGYILGRFNNPDYAMA